MTKGSLLRVRVNDAGQYLSKGAGALLLGIAGTSTRFLPLTVASSDAGGRTLNIAIPVNAALRLEISSFRLALADELGTPLAATPPPIPILQLAGQPDRTVTLQITGTR